MSKPVLKILDIDVQKYQEVYTEDAYLYVSSLHIYMRSTDRTNDLMQTHSNATKKNLSQRYISLLLYFFSKALVYIYIHCVMDTFKTYVNC